MIGQMQSDVKHTRNSVESIHLKVDDLSSKSARQETETEFIKKKIQYILPVVEDYKKTKNFGMAVLATLASVFGAAGAALSKMVGVFF